jgi:hypothetical protein
MSQLKSRRNQILTLVFKKRVLIPVLALLCICMIRIDLSGRHTPATQRERILEYIETFDPRHTPRAEREALVDLIMRESRRLEVPASMKIDGRAISRAYLLTAYIRVESSFNPRARSYSDARGYMQLKPLTARWIRRSLRGRLVRGGLNLYDIQVNVELGVDYINYLMTEMVDARSVALAYNAGPSSVRQGRYIEEYWDRILHTYRQLRSREFRENLVEL